MAHARAAAQAEALRAGGKAHARFGSPGALAADIALLNRKLTLRDPHAGKSLQAAT